ncbi:HDOD domain-containing protein [Methylomonas sp. MgM2]
MSLFKNIFHSTATTTKRHIPKALDRRNRSARTDAPHTTPPLVECQQNLNAEQLKKFAPLRDLDNQSLKTLSHTTSLYHKDAIIFVRDEPTDGIYYILEGKLEMQPYSDNRYEVEAETPLAALPLNSGKRFGATATASTDVTILKVTAELNQLWALQPQESLSCVELLDIQLPEEISNKQFFDSFAKACRENKLRLPSLPNVAIKLQQAMRQNIGINDAVKIIQIDPPIVAKLIQAANSPLYASVNPVNNCHDAVNRIGLTGVRNLILSISLKQLFQSKDRELMNGMQKLWKSSLYVSSLCFVLAEECSGINPEDALLAGLICDIGAIPLLHFAERFPEHYPNLTELEASLPYFRGPVGALVLHTLGFSKELTNIPQQSENWLYDSGDALDITDIVILAKLHRYFGTHKAKDLPYINSIPAYSKVNESKLDPDFSLSMLHKAQNRVDSIMHLFS